MPSKRRSSKRPYGEPHPELDVDRVSNATGGRREAGPGGEEFIVVTPRPTDKTYVCPACRQDIPPRTPHIVAWAADGLFGPEQAAAQRRHWHTHCWNTFGRNRG
ncbi:hypothetical protein [Demequina sp. SO4-18]|uniref:hypothetical protein n=1 Tax=Demequina sp. SO4-18 TaxID=3401026 RepID=UPI003B5A4AC9